MRRFPKVPDSLAPRRRRFHVYVRLALYVGAGGWLILTGLYLYKFHGALSGRQEVWAQFGDYLGGMLNPILGFASFLVVLLSLYENRLQAAEERRSRAAETLTGTFSFLLKRVSEVLDDLRYECTRVIPVGLATAAASVEEVRGREAFRAMFFHALKTPYTHDPGPRDAPDVERYIALMKKLYADWDYELGVYFRSLYHLFTYVDSSDLSLEEKTRLANFGRAQISAYELALLFYNSLWGEGRATFKPLAEKYGLFKHLHEPHVLNPLDLVPGTLFAETAFVGFDRRLELWKGVEPLLDAE